MTYLRRCLRRPAVCALALVRLAGSLPAGLLRLCVLRWAAALPTGERGLTPDEAVIGMRNSLCMAVVMF